MRKKITLRPVMVRGKKMFVVRWHAVDGERMGLRKSFFSAADKAGAVAFQSLKKGEFLRADDRFYMLPADAKERMLMAWKIAQERGLDLLALAQSARAVIEAPAAGEILKLLIAAKKEVGCKKEYLSGLKSICAEFIAGREAASLSDFSLAEVKTFLASKGPDYRATVRSRLSGFFNFALKHEWILRNPCALLEEVKVAKKPVVILTPEQAKGCIAFLLKAVVGASTTDARRPRPGDADPGLAWFILTAFGALRPEEASKLGPQLLHLKSDRPFVEITPEITKTGMQRIVYLLPPVVAALRWALEHGSVLPFAGMRKKRLQVRLRAVLGLEAWPKDVTRHSGVSYWLAMEPDKKFVAEMAGHTEAVQRKHYKKPVEVATASAFYETLKAVGMKKVE